MIGTGNVSFHFLEKYDYLSFVVFVHCDVTFATLLQDGEHVRQAKK